MNQASSWDSYWESESNRDYWLEPDQAVIALVARLDKSKVRDVLDLGCGIGRHALWFAHASFNVTAVDISESAIAVLRGRAGEDNRVRIVTGAYSEDLFAEGSFDLVLAWNVLYHGRREDFIRATRFVHKWLRPDGLLFFTCPTRRDAKYGNGEEVAPNTYRSLNSIHPGDVHYFADRSDMTDFLGGFELISEETSELHWDNKGNRQFSSYWHILAKKATD
jgi:tellurite methyltransferase